MQDQIGQFQPLRSRLAAARRILRILLGISANNQELTIDDDFTVERIEVYEDPLFTLITVNGRHVYIHR